MGRSCFFRPSPRLHHARSRSQVHLKEWIEFQIRDKADMPLKLAQEELHAMMEKLEESLTRKVLQSPRGGARS